MHLKHKNFASNIFQFPPALFSSCLSINKIDWSISGDKQWIVCSYLEAHFLDWSYFSWRKSATLSWHWSLITSSPAVGSKEVTSASIIFTTSCWIRLTTPVRLKMKNIFLHKNISYSNLFHLNAKQAAEALWIAGIVVSIGFSKIISLMQNVGFSCNLLLN